MINSKIHQFRSPRFQGIAVSWSHHWVWVAVLLPLLGDVLLRMRGRAQVIAAGLLPAWTMMLLAWPLRRRPEDPLKANGIIWVAYRHDQPVRWLGENIYVLAVLGTMLLAAWWLRNHRDSPRIPPPIPPQRRGIGDLVATATPSSRTRGVAASTVCRVAGGSFTLQLSQNRT